MHCLGYFVHLFRNFSISASKHSMIHNKLCLLLSINILPLRASIKRTSHISGGHIFIISKKKIRTKQTSRYKNLCNPNFEIILQLTYSRTLLFLLPQIQGKPKKFPLRHINHIIPYNQHYCMERLTQYAQNTYNYYDVYIQQNICRHIRYTHPK